MHRKLHLLPRPLFGILAFSILFPLLLLVPNLSGQAAEDAPELLSPLTGRPLRAEQDLPTSLDRKSELAKRLEATTINLKVEKQFEETSFYLKDTDFVSSTLGWAVGAPHWDQSVKANVGTIIRSSDGGENWSTQTAPVAKTLNGVDSVDAQTGWAVGAEGTVLHTSDGGTHWTSQPIATTDELLGLVFADSNHGWTTSLRPIHYDWTGNPDNWRAGVWYTANGGATWVEQTVPIGASILQDIDFVDAQTGWVVGIKYIGDDQYGDPDHRMVVYQTQNGGQTWTELYNPDLEISLTAVDFIDATHGWAVGFPWSLGDEDGAVFHTTDGGQTWDRQEPGSALDQIWDVKFIDQDRGYAVGADYISAWGTPVWRTSDGGATWEKVRMEQEENDPLFGLFVDEDRAVAVGSHDYLVISTDPWGPYSWPWGEDLFTQQFINVHYRFEDVFFADESQGWAVGSRSYGPQFTGQVILHTSNGGETWDTQHEKAPYVSSLSSYLRLDSVYFVDAISGWAVGVSEDKQDAILHTSDGGQTWGEQGQELYASGDAEFVDVKFLDLQKGWALSCKNSYPDYSVWLAHTIDGGVSWEWVNTGIEGIVCVGFGTVMGGLDFTDAQHGWALSRSGKVVHTEDGGVTWSAQPLDCGHPSCPINLHGIDMIDTQEGWIAGEDLYHTSDGGLHWDIWVVGDAGDWLQDVQFLDAQNGWVTGDDGYAAYTTDGGSTWTAVENTVANVTLRGLSFVSPEKGWLVGDYGAILTTIVTATPDYALSVSLAGAGSGNVSSNPPGIDCGSDCSESFEAGTSVTLTAAPGTGSAFAGWSGDCSGTQLTCILTISEDRNVVATFEPTGGPCPAQAVLAQDEDRESWLRLLYRFRERVLQASPDGPWMVAAYKRHTREVAKRLMKDGTLRSQARRLLRQLRPALEAVVADNSWKLRDADVSAVVELARTLQQGASKGLSVDLEHFLGLEWPLQKQVTEN